MSPTEFSNYIKQRAMQQQIHHHHHQPHQQAGPQGPQPSGGLPVSQSSPNSRSLSPGLVNGHSQHAAAAAAADPSAYFFHQAPPPGYHPQFSHRNIFDSTSSHGGYLSVAAAARVTDLYTNTKFPSSYIDPVTIGHQFYGNVNASGSSGTQTNTNALGPIGSATATAAAAAVAATGTASTAATQQQQAADKAALVDGLNNFGLGSVTPYPASNYQHLLVAN